VVMLAEAVDWLVDLVEFEEAHAAWEAEEARVVWSVSVSDMAACYPCAQVSDASSEVKVARSPWPTSISEMIGKRWRYPNGETFTREAWAQLDQHDKGTRSLFLVCGPEADALWAPFFAAEAERRGMSLKTLEEMLIAHVGTKYVKTGRGARSTFFGIDIRRDVGRTRVAHLALQWLRDGPGLLRCGSLLSRRIVAEPIE
jgi:hypothetical protein